MIVHQATAYVERTFSGAARYRDRGCIAAIKEFPIKPVALVRGDPFKKLVREPKSPRKGWTPISSSPRLRRISAAATEGRGQGLITYAHAGIILTLLHALYEIRVVDGKTFESSKAGRRPARQRVDSAGSRAPAC